MCQCEFSTTTPEFNSVFTGIVRGMSSRSVNGLEFVNELGEYKCVSNFFSNLKKSWRKSSMRFANYQLEVGQGKLTAVASKIKNKVLSVSSSSEQSGIVGCVGVYIV